MKAVWTPTALRHLGAIAAYLEEQSPATTEAVLTRIIDAVERTLLAFPWAGPAMVSREARCYFVSGYRYAIVYRVREDQLEVLGVFHTSENWRNKL